MEFINGILGAVGAGIAVIVALIIVVLIVWRGYEKADPDEALIITGLGDKPKVVIGRSVFRIPFVQSSPATLTLRPIRVDLGTDDWVPTADFIGAKVTATVNVKVDTASEDTIRLAAQHWSDMKTEKIGEAIRGTLEGNVKEIIGKMDLKDAATDRKKFGEQVLDSAQPVMQALGLQVLTFNMKSLTDNQGVLAALGLENEAQIKKSAAIAAAAAEQEVREKKAETAQAANKAEAESRMAIAERETEVKKKKAALKKEADAAQAEADIAYQLQEEQQRKDLEQFTVEADIARQAKEVELEEQRVAVRERELEATKKKTADAELYERQRKAEAELYERQKKAEADKAEAELAAQANRAKADAELYAKQKEAAGVKALAEAEADKEREVGLAKAQALEKEAEAMERLGHAALGKMMIEKLPDIAHELAAPMGNIDSVKIFGGGNDSGIGTYMDSMPVAFAKLFETMNASTGIDMRDLVSGNGLKAKTERNIHVDGIDQDEAEEAAKLLSAMDGGDEALGWKGAAASADE